MPLRRAGGGAGSARSGMPAGGVGYSTAMAGTAIVTGAGSGLGRHVALALPRAAYGIVVADAARPAAGECAAQIKALGRPARAVVADVRERAGLDRVVAAATELGDLRVLVNNAGGWTPRRQYPAATAEEWTG